MAPPHPDLPTRYQRLAVFGVTRSSRATSAGVARWTTDQR